MARLFGVLLLALATVAGAQPKTDEKLELVVALFRHGIRPPLHNLNEPKWMTRYAQNDWPSLGDWGVSAWGDLTPQGDRVANALGYGYGLRYTTRLPRGSEAFLWADGADERTRATAAALAKGLTRGGITAITRDGGTGTDPLFHPFKAGCESPSAKHVLAISANITTNAKHDIEQTYAAPFQTLYGVLACSTNCSKLKDVKANGAGYCVHPELCGSSLIKWEGQFPVANTVSETFLLEYENRMTVGWKDSPVSDAQMIEMMKLHEFYFDQTQREPYLATIEGSNLVWEIGRALNRRAGECQRIPAGYAFGALVGHDTNIAAVASLLGLTWNFQNANGITKNLPDNDPLPAGALVFELWTGGDDSTVRIFYEAMGLTEAKLCGYPDENCASFRVPLREMSLKAFTMLADDVAGKSHSCACAGVEQKPKHHQP